MCSSSAFVNSTFESIAFFLFLLGDGKEEMKNMQTNSKESTEKKKSHLISLNSKVRGTKRTLKSRD